jgi:translation initiation factor IF-2
VAADADEKQLQRPPVVTVMGHVDHGKTSLLDAIRKSRVAVGEAGGITQHIGAYSVPVKGKGTVTFLDTPGHAAFTSMRARGAQVTDLVVLVVAADDGVMPQTEEAIRHAQAAKVPIIVAVNKIDKPEANADRVMQELTKFELLPEAWGGDTLYVNTSATKGTGIDELLETILLQSEVLELTANPDRPAIGVVVEAQLDKGRGPVATVLVQQGTLKRGDAIVVGCASGKLRAMMDDTGKLLDSAGPSTAVEVTGLDAVPDAGDTLNVVESAEVAREVAGHRVNQRRTQEQVGGNMSLEDLMRRMQGQAGLELKIVLKADVQGSVEAVRGALLKLATDEVKVNVIYGGVGAIKESDIMLAAASGGIVLGFGVRPDTNARIISEREGVEVRTYTIIYEAIDDVRRAMEGLLTPESREKVVGRAEVRDLFKVSKVGTIGGSRVLEGKAMRSARVRVLRDSVQIYEGKVSSLRHFKNDVREVDTGLECGIGVEGYNDLKAGDVIEFFTIEEVARTLSPAAGAPSKRGAAPAYEAHP